MRDPYDLLGVSRTATQDQIKKAYRRLVKDLHPDLNPGDRIVEQRFKEVSAAYDLLSDQEKRARFDRGEIDAEGRQRADFGFQRAHAEAMHRRGRARAPFGPGAGGFSAHDIFNDLFGRGPARSKGADLSHKLDVSFLEAVRGCRKRLRLAGGRDLEVVVPPGTEDGQTLRLRGQGTSGLAGGPPGDALVEVRIAAHAFFTRKQSDIHVEVPITLHEAVLGAVIEVPTIDGKVAVKVPAGANTGTSLRLKGKGLAKRGKPDERGDQYVKLKLVLPDQPDADLSDFVRRWKPAGPFDPRRRAGLV